MEIDIGVTLKFKGYYCDGNVSESNHKYIMVTIPRVKTRIGILPIFYK